MAKVGRPAFEVTPEVVAKVEGLAAQGLDLVQIANVLGINRSTLCKKKAQFEELEDAIKRGRDKGIAAISNALFQKAKKGDTTSMIFFLKCRAGWREQEAEQKDIPPINITLTKD